MEVSGVAKTARAPRIRGVDLQELCANLREYLCLVSAGETVVVTDCGHVVAQITAPQPRVSLRPIDAAGAREPAPPASVLSLTGLPAGVGVDGGAV